MEEIYSPRQLISNAHASNRLPDLYTGQPDDQQPHHHRWQTPLAHQDSGCEEWMQVKNTQAFLSRILSRTVSGEHQFDALYQLTVRY